MKTGENKGEDGDLIQVWKYYEHRALSALHALCCHSDGLEAGNFEGKRQRGLSLWLLQEARWVFVEHQVINQRQFHLQQKSHSHMHIPYFHQKLLH